MTKTMLFKDIDTFLKTYRASDRGSWAEVTATDWGMLHSIIDSLIKLKFEEDGDGDLPIEYVLVNRRTHERMNYSPMPYDQFESSHGASDEDRFETAMSNLSVAQTSAQLCFKLMRDHKRWGKNASR